MELQLVCADDFDTSHDEDELPEEEYILTEQLLFPEMLIPIAGPNFAVCIFLPEQSCLHTSCLLTRACT